MRNQSEIQQRQETLQSQRTAATEQQDQVNQTINRLQDIQDRLDQVENPRSTSVTLTLGGETIETTAEKAKGLIEERQRELRQQRTDLTNLLFTLDKQEIRLQQAEAVAEDQRSQTGQGEEAGGFAVEMRDQPTARERISAGSEVDVSRDESVVDQAVDVATDAGGNILQTLGENPASLGRIVTSPSSFVDALTPDSRDEFREQSSDVLDFGTELILTGQEISADAATVIDETNAAEQFVAERTASPTNPVFPTDIISQTVTAAEGAEQAAPVVNDVVEAAGGPELLPESDTVTEDAVKGLATGTATLGTQGPGFFIAGTGGLGVMAADAVEDPREEAEAFTRSVPAFARLTADQFREDPVGFVAEETGEEVSEAAVGGLLLGPAGAALGALPTLDIETGSEPTIEPDRGGGGMPASQTRIRVDEEGNVYRNLEQEPIGQFQGLTGRMAQARATRSRLRFGMVDAERAADAADATHIEPDQERSAGDETDTGVDVPEEGFVDDVAEAAGLSIDTEDTAEPDSEQDTGQDTARDIVEEGLGEGRSLDEINEELEERGVRAVEVDDQIALQEIEEEQDQESDVPEGFEVQEEVEVEELSPPEEESMQDADEDLRGGLRLQPGDLEQETEQLEQTVEELEMGTQLQQQLAEEQDIESEQEQAADTDQELDQVQAQTEVEVAGIDQNLQAEQELMQEQDQRLDQDLRAEPDVAQDQVQEPELDQDQRQGPDLIVDPRLTSDLELRPPEQPPELEPEPEPDPNRPPDIPEINFDRGGKDSAGEEITVSEAAETQFAPSLEAVVFNIRGDAPVGDLSGLELRPLPEEDV
ncbi:MAG: hypothetical protein SVW02_00685 [Candidatus Nanohaloarchaea archaeon]|nr:hypothetical protein [Candidatus Nanohaloarchaea archaeon]